MKSYRKGTSALRKHADAKLQRFFFSHKNENISGKVMIFPFFSAQNIGCGYTLEPPHRGGSNEYPQSMFRTKNKKKMYTPAYPSY